jgi:hypothetical protein
MTIFEYIKQKATKEEIAKMFTFLENDSGYYNENNASVLLMLGKLDNWYSTNYEDDKMYNLVMKYLNKEIGDK